MKLIVAALFVCAVYSVNAGNLWRGNGQYAQNVTEMVREFGYPVQNFTVTTVDGYILDVVRVPGSRDFRSTFENKQREAGRDSVKTDRPVVILAHAMLSSSEDFVVGGPQDGLAFVLADAGFDVFMANFRGSRYGRKHTTLNPERDSAFWRFCFHDMATKDLPAIIDGVSEMSSRDKIFFVGHMEATTSMFVLSSTVPEYNRKIEMIVALGPMAFMKGTTNEAMKLISENYQSKSWVLKNLGGNEFHPTTDFISEVSHDCINRNVNERICQNPFFLINGYESSVMNTTTISRYMYNLPAGTSTKNVLHFAHLVRTGNFETYNDEIRTKNSITGDRVEPTKYQLDRVNVPVTIFYAGEDRLVAERDIERLVAELPQVVRQVHCAECQNNLDLIFARDVKTNVFDGIVSAMKSYRNRQ